jgi:hypothetical protein
MSTLLAILDFVVLLALVVLAVRAVWKPQSQGSGSLTLAAFTALVLVTFAMISFASYLGLVETSSSLMRGIFLLILLVFAALLNVIWAAKPAT